MSYVEWIRSKVGSRKIFLTFASVVLRDGNGRILLQRRTDFDVWGLPGGVLEIDEDITACARRELAEETGLTAGGLALIGIYTHPRYDVVYPNGDEVQQFTVCFQGRVSGGRMRVDGVETSQQRFFAPAEIDGLTLPTWYRAMLRDAQVGGPPTFEPPYSNGRPIDQIAAVRPHIGTARYIGVGASVLVEREDGRILLLRRVGESHWHMPAGYADLGETLSQTAVREVHEETGLDIWPEAVAAVYSSPRMCHTYANGDRVKIAGVLFRASLLGGSVRLDTREIDALGWFSRSEIRDQRLAGRLQWLYDAVLANVDVRCLVF